MNSAVPQQTSSQQQPLWSPSTQQIEQTHLYKFMQQASATTGLDLHDYDTLWEWSTTHLNTFWNLVWDFADIKASQRGDNAYLPGETMREARFFPDAKLNFAENLLRRRDDGVAIIARAEDQWQQQLTWNELYQQVSQVAQALQAAGVKSGDRVGGFLPNIPVAIVGHLAAASIGAIWTSCSPDFGVSGVLDRFGQSKPKVLLVADGYYFKGTKHDSLSKIAEFTAELPSIEQIVVYPFTESAPDISSLPNAVLWQDWLAPHTPQDEIKFAQLPFDHPLVIMYSSGTTGKPKCIVHRTGGVLLNLFKEHLLQVDTREDDRVFYFTTIGWMMWNWQIAALGVGATLMLYDGSPFSPSKDYLFSYAAEEKATLFGTSAKYIDACAKFKLNPAKTHNLADLRVLTSTGSPLSPDGFRYTYNAIKNDLQLASICGGTDIVGLFMGGASTEPVYAGEIQKPCLGMAVDAFDANGQPVRGQAGELVCTQPFPSMPVKFWGDDSGEKYNSAYFEGFPNVWTHGDYVEFSDHNGLIVFGRSDATLNPQGVRIGTAEIYRQVDLFPEVQESMVIGQEWDNDTRVVLFVMMAEGQQFSDELARNIRQTIRTNCTPRHVPSKVIPVPDLPRTINGKLPELAVRDTVHGRPVKNATALANPEALEFFKDIPELQR